MGTFCTFSLRLLAVTTMSPKPEPFDAGGVA
jgi:hypothetical protein